MGSIFRPRTEFRACTAPKYRCISVNATTLKLALSSLELYCSSCVGMFVVPATSTLQSCSSRFKTRGQLPRVFEPESPRPAELSNPTIHSLYRRGENPYAARTAGITRLLHKSLHRFFQDGFFRSLRVHFTHSPCGRLQSHKHKRQHLSARFHVMPALCAIPSS